MSDSSEAIGPPKEVPMSSTLRAGASALLALVPALAFPLAAAAQCPPADQVGAAIQRVFKPPVERKIEVKKVVPTPMKGLCEVQVSVQGRPNLLYTDATGAYFVSGHLFDMASGKDLSEESLAVLNAFTPAEMERASALTALTLGTKGPVVYFVTDPM
jgi:thiol:disulfide interchange protein DsbC